MTLPNLLVVGAQRCGTTSAWLLRGQVFEAVIGNWSPVSFTGVPLAVAAAPAPMLVLTGWVTLYLVEALALPEHEALDQHPSGPALQIPALAVVALANNLITLVVGLGIVDLISVYVALRRKTGEQQALSTLVLNGLSGSALLVAVAVQYASGSSLSLPLSQFQAGLTPFIKLKPNSRVIFPGMSGRKAFFFAGVASFFTESGSCA